MDHTIARLRARLGLACWVICGLLTTVGLYLRGPIINQQAHTEAYMQGALGATHEAAWLLLIPNLTFQVFAWMAIWLAVANTRLEKLAWWGFVLSVFGNGLFLPITGVIAFISPAVAELYFAGVTEVVDIANAGLADSFALVFLVISALGLLLGSMLMAIVFWKDERIPGWTAPLYVWHGLCLTFVAPFSYPLEFSGGISLLLVGCAIAWSLWDKPVPVAVTATA